MVSPISPEFNQTANKIAPDIPIAYHFAAKQMPTPNT